MSAPYSHELARKAASILGLAWVERSREVEPLRDESLLVYERVLSRMTGLSHFVRLGTTTAVDLSPTVTEVDGGEP